MTHNTHRPPASTGTQAPSPTPPWVWLLCLAIALIEPITHFVLRHGLPDSIVFTGLHIGDTPFFLTSMDIFANGFFSPYADCQSTLGTHNPAYFALPHHWLYGALGGLAHLAGVSTFLALGVANGLAAGAYLYAVYQFLRTATPQLAHRAFLLFTLGGGLGGILYLITGVLGLHGLPAFTDYFHRYARYELIEGPFLAPWLVAPRLYYTLPLACGFASLTAFVRGSRRGQARPGAAALAALFAASYFNARVGPVIWLAAALYLATQSTRPHAARLRYGLVYLLPALTGAALALGQLRLNPAATENVAELLRRCVWYSAFLSVAVWHLLAAPTAVRESLTTLPRWGRAAVYAALGYLAAFSLLYLVHQIYYGSLSYGGDTAAATIVSDWALLGAVLGLIIWRRHEARRFEHPIRSGTPASVPPETAEHPVDWFVLWLLILLPISLSAWGQGWLLRWMPERLMALLGVPLAVISAQGIAIMSRTAPRRAHALMALFMTCGVCSLLVAVLCYQAPLGHTPGHGPFRWVHSEIMSPADARLIEKIPQGTVLAPASLPPLFGDIIVRARPRTSTVFGQPSLEFSGVNMLKTGKAVQDFFAEDATPSARLDFVTKQEVDYVYCPDTRPVPAGVLDNLRQTPWLEETAQKGHGALFRVQR